MPFQQSRPLSIRPITATTRTRRRRRRPILEALEGRLVLSTLTVTSARTTARGRSAPRSPRPSPATRSSSRRAWTARPST